MTLRTRSAGALFPDAQGHEEDGPLSEEIRNSSKELKRRRTRRRESSQRSLDGAVEGFKTLPRLAASAQKAQQPLAQTEEAVTVLLAELQAGRQQPPRDEPLRHLRGLGRGLGARSTASRRSSPARVACASTPLDAGPPKDEASAEGPKSGRENGDRGIGRRGCGDRLRQNLTRCLHRLGELT